MGPWVLRRTRPPDAMLRRRWRRAAVAFLLLAGASAEAAPVDEEARRASPAGLGLRGGAGHPGGQLGTSQAGRSLSEGIDTTPPPVNPAPEVDDEFGPEVLPPNTTPEPAESPYSHPNAMQWVLAAILVALLFAHLARIWRVLRGENTLVLQHSAPDGMRTVQCGQCQKMQYLQISIRNFICYNCQSTNRLTVDLLRSASGTPVPELVENTGPCKRYEFRKQGNLYWQMISEETEDGQVADITAEPEKSGEVDPERGNRPAEAEAQAEAEADASTARAEPGPDEVADAATTSEKESENASRAGEWESCGVCWDNPGYMVLLPCSHGNVCEYCATRIAQNRATGGSHCPHCRADITMLVKLTDLRTENDEVLARGVEHRVPIARVLGASTIGS